MRNVWEQIRIQSMKWIQQRTFYRRPDDVPKLGRWSIQYENHVIYRKIDQANEDHCGCCEFTSHEEPLDPTEEEKLIPYCM